MKSAPFSVWLNEAQQAAAAIALSDAFLRPYRAATICVSRIPSPFSAAHSAYVSGEGEAIIAGHSLPSEQDTSSPSHASKEALPFRKKVIDRS